MSQPIDGRSLALRIRRNLEPRVRKLVRPPGLNVLLVGHDPASELYVRLKGRAAERLGLRFALERFSTDSGEDAMLDRLDALNVSPTVDAILVQLPLPKPLHESTIIERIDPEKDVDGFHPVNTARYLNGERTNPPGLIEGILRLITITGRPLDGLTGVIVARESVFSTCLEHALAMSGILALTVPPDGHHRASTIGADLLIVAAGQAGLIIEDDVKPEAVIIDVGINAQPNGQVVGDVDPGAYRRASWYTPVPGGVGPMTIAMLLENAVRLAELRETP